MKHDLDPYDPPPHWSDLSAPGKFMEIPDRPNPRFCSVCGPHARLWNNLTAVARRVFVRWKTIYPHAKPVRNPTVDEFKTWVCDAHNVVWVVNPKGTVTERLTQKDWLKRRRKGWDQMHLEEHRWRNGGCGECDVCAAAQARGFFPNESRKPPAQEVEA